MADPEGQQTPRSTTREAGTKRATTRKTAATKAANASSSDQGRERRPTAPRGSAHRSPQEPLGAAAVASRAAGQLLELTGREAEGVTGISRTEDGWTVQVEVVESRRIPDTTDVLGLYAVDVDADGELVGYQRVRRYVRGKPSEG